MDEDIKLQEALEREQDVEFGDFYADAVRAGAIPTFEEFKKDPDKMRRDRENLFAQIDQGQTMLRNLKRQKYFFKTRSGNKYECGKSLERVAAIALEEGIHFSQLKPYPELVEDSSATITCEITFCPPGVKP